MQLGGNSPLGEPHESLQLQPWPPRVCPQSLPSPHGGSYLPVRAFPPTVPSVVFGMPRAAVGVIGGLARAGKRRSNRARIAAPRTHRDIVYFVIVCLKKEIFFFAVGIYPPVSAPYRAGRKRVSPLPPRDCHTLSVGAACAETGAW